MGLQLYCTVISVTSASGRGLGGSRVLFVVCVRSLSVGSSVGIGEFLGSLRLIYTSLKFGVNRGYMCRIVLTEYSVA